MNKLKICVVIVTYNRKNKLENALRCYSKQTLLPKHVIVVNNASTDGTKELLSNWSSLDEGYNKIVINCNENLGGSSGFYIGIKKALELDSNWIWVSDDDAYPNDNSFEIANDFITNSTETLAAICGSVYVNGYIDCSHRRIINRKLFRLKDKALDENMYNNAYFELNEFSYVGTMMNKEIVKIAGLPKKEYFIHYDDTEHSLRMSKYGKIYCIPSIKIKHDIEKKQDSNNDSYNSSWQKYYDYRNLLDMIKSNFPSRYYLIQLFIYRIKLVFHKITFKNQDEYIILKDSINDFKNGIWGKNLKHFPN